MATNHVPPTVCYEIYPIKGVEIDFKDLDNINKDIFKVLSSQTLWINEKQMLLKSIDILLRTGYYSSNRSIFSNTLESE